MSSSSLSYSFLQIQALFLAVGLVAIILLITYRLTLHPLARVPGPVLAAATGAYEVYFQLFKEGGGRYWVEIDRLHERYGPIVRINPWEVHIKDPNWNDMFKLSSKACKPIWYHRNLGSTLNANGTESDYLHRIRRQALQTWFSTQNIARHTPDVHAMVDRLHDRLLASGKIVRLDDAYRCLAVDVATGFAFQKPFRNLDDPTFSSEFIQAVKDYGRMGIVNRHLFGLPFLLLKWMPEFLSKKISPTVHGFMATIRECATRSVNKAPMPHEKAQDMVQSILTADIPPEEKSFARILAECRGVVLAGQETTGTVLTSVTFHVLSNPAIAGRLFSELKEARSVKGTALEYKDLRALPYLTAVINEALRTCNAVSGRLSRYSKVADFHYQGHFLPRGTFISINIKDAHMDPTIFPDPDNFLPDRWLNKSDYKRLSKYLQPWGRGDRTCTGMELANTDMYLAVARLFGPDCGFSMKLFETTLDDCAAYTDYMGPLPMPGSKGLRVLIDPKVD